MSCGKVRQPLQWAPWIRRVPERDVRKAFGLARGRCGGIGSAFNVGPRTTPHLRNLRGPRQSEEQPRVSIVVSRRTLPRETSSSPNLRLPPQVCWNLQPGGTAARRKKRAYPVARSQALGRAASDRLGMGFLDFWTRKSARAFLRDVSPHRGFRTGAGEGVASGRAGTLRGIAFGPRNFTPASLGTWAILPMA